MSRRWSFNAKPTTDTANAHPYGLNPFGHQGLAHDPTTGLMYNRERMRDPQLGWLQRDRAEYVDGPNLYQYVASNPINRLDPSGMYLIPPPNQQPGINSPMELGHALMTNWALLNGALFERGGDAMKSDAGFKNFFRPIVSQIAMDLCERLEPGEFERGVDLRGVRNGGFNIPNIWQSGWLTHTLGGSHRVPTLFSYKAGKKDQAPCPCIVEITTQGTWVDRGDMEPQHFPDFMLAWAEDYLPLAGEPFDIEIGFQGTAYFIDAPGEPPQRSGWPFE
jgi:RHS repeat-associated protein